MSTTTITVYRYNKPAANIKVQLEFTGISNLGFTRACYTNNNGIAYVQHSSSGTANVYLNGRKVGTVSTPGSGVYYL